MPGREAMPRRSPAAHESRRQKNPAASFAKMRALALDMEELLNEIETLLEGLRFIGYGLEYHRVNGGSAISHLAWTANGQLGALKDIWNKMFEA